MTDRRATGGVAAICPFVAFADERDARAGEPDHRHRCYAEVTPAPRALAHQAAFCLSTAFPTCPTFQDWARREAARASASVPAAPAPPEPEPEPPRSSRAWNAPPPWAAGTAGAARPEPPDVDEGSIPGAEAAMPPTGVPAEARGLADRLRERGEWEEPVAEEPPSFLAGRAGRSVVERDLGRRAADDGRTWPPARDVPGRGRAWDELDEDRDIDDEWYEEDFGTGEDGGRAAAMARLEGRRGRGRPRVGQARPTGRDPDVPSWERPRRREAYPSLKTRVGLPEIPRIGLMAIALGVAALGLFIVPPLIVDFLTGSPGTGAPVVTPSPTAGSAAPATPTPIAEPTPQVYVVKPGDTLSRIATQFGLTLDQLLAANPEITNPNRIAVGDQIIIPTPDASDPGGESPAP